VRQVSVDDKPCSEKSRSLNVSIKLIYMNKTSHKNFNQTIILFDANYITCIEITSIPFETLKNCLNFSRIQFEYDVCDVKKTHYYVFETT